MTELILSNVSFCYKDLPVLHDVSLSIGRGEKIALVGANGSGKSTLVKLLNGLLLPTSGKVSFNGLDTVNTINLSRIRKSIGYVFQNPENQMVAATVREEVAFGPRNLGFAQEQVEQRVESTLQFMNLQQLQNHLTDQLSGGQIQRVAIASALAMEPEILVCDESASMLDSHAKKEFKAILGQLNITKEMTIILVTHDMEDLLWANRVIVLAKGRVRYDGCPRQFLSVNNYNDLGLELPNIKLMVKMLQDKGCKVPDSVNSNEELVMWIANQIG